MMCEFGMVVWLCDSSMYVDVCGVVVFLCLMSGRVVCVVLYVGVYGRFDGV